MQTPETILSENGPLADLIPDFSSRPQQIELAQTIEQAFANQESLICEAGTGTGKTFAYLVPALLSGMKVIVSTGTRHLQDQLYLRDLPLVHKSLGLPVNLALLKGRANYLCLQHLHSSESEHRYLDKKSIAQLMDIREWAQHTTHGDLAELGHIPEDASVRSVVTSTTENCLGQDCDHYDKCHLFRARNNASNADLVVVNHHLFFADLALRAQGFGELLPTADMVIFDEAHQIPDLASMFFSQTLSSRQILELIQDSKAAYFEEAADLPDFLEILDKLDKSVRDLRLAFGQNEQRVSWSEINHKKEIKDSFAELMSRNHDLHTALYSLAERGKSLDNCFNRVTNILNMLDSYNESSSVEFIQWLEMRGSGFLLHQTPLDIAETFQSRMRDYNCESIYTSATLTVNNNFKHFVSQLGLNEVKSQSWESPFNFKKQALLYLPQAMPDPREQGYTEEVVARALPVLTLTRGRAFILFTSHRALKIAAELIRDQIDYPVLVQGDAPRTDLLDSFRNTRHAVLLGTSSFWEGVDVKGQALSCVIIDKLPFSSPGDPVLKARMRMMEEQGRNPFMEHQLPEAVIVLKQGIGRLIRDQNDYGVLMICDPRLKTKPYGKVFINSLPEMNQTQNLGDVESFFTEFESS
jgi:ATP-dependent DNA helicase DinG